MRQRLSWDEEKVAEIMKEADPYTMNQTRTNPPASKYDIGGPSQFGEDQDKSTPWKSEGRTETGHPSPAARQAVVQARKLEDKALKCITIAQRMLPGADDTLIEDMASDLMFLPEKSVLATLQRQSDLATKIASEQEEVEAKAKPEVEEEEKPEVEAKAKPEEKPEVEEEEKPEVEAKAKPEVEEEEKPEVEAKAKPEVEEEEKPEVEAKKCEKKEEEMAVEANDDLLDILFDSAEVVETPKTGAKKLSGLVKQASEGDPLANLWDAPPDVSGAFK